jgi:hypothetical protein
MSSRVEPELNVEGRIRQHQAFQDFQPTSNCVIKYSLLTNYFVPKMVEQQSREDSFRSHRVWIWTAGRVSSLGKTALYTIGFVLMVIKTLLRFILTTLTLNLLKNRFPSLSYHACGRDFDVTIELLKKTALSIWGVIWSPPKGNISVIKSISTVAKRVWGIHQNFLRVPYETNQLVWRDMMQAVQCMDAILGYTPY